MLMDEEMVDINIDSKGEILPQKNDKIALIDADTIVFASCTTLAITDELLPIEMYREDEWSEIIGDPGYNEKTHTISFLNMQEAMVHAQEKIDFILERTGCTDFELHFTIGRNSLPYKVDKNYKANRAGKPAPYGIMLLKEEFHGKYPDKVYMNTECEADHAVIAKKIKEYDKYVLCAVDKDVLKALPGTHFNYYQSTLYNIDMKWIENTEDEATRWCYIQTLMGDPGDGVIGLHGIGPKKAELTLKKCKTELDYWEAVVKMYEKHGRGIVDAITNMRLVDMKQVYFNESGDCITTLWKPGYTMERRLHEPYGMG